MLLCYCQLKTKDMGLHFMSKHTLSQWKKTLHSLAENFWCYIDGLVQDCSISSALAMEILQSCTKPLTCLCPEYILCLNTFSANEGRRYTHWLKTSGVTSLCPKLINLNLNPHAFSLSLGKVTGRISVNPPCCRSPGPIWSPVWCC